MKDIITLFHSVAVKKSVKKRMTLFYQGEIPRHAHIITHGLVKACSVSSTGEERIVGLYSVGDILPLTWVLGESTHTLFYYETIEDCQILTISRAALLEILDTEPGKASILRHMARSYTSALIRITALEQSRAVEKICLTLYYLMFNFGSETKPGVYSININLTQPMLASLVGVTRETTTINLNMLRRKGVIAYRGHKFSINKPLLEKFLGEDSFKTLVQS